MDMYIVSVVIGIVFMILGGKNKMFWNKNNDKVTNRRVPMEDEGHPVIIVKDPDFQLYKKFMEKYDPSKDFKFDNVTYRPGARNTCPFGISNGFKYINNKMEWGYVRMHTGVDRAGAAERAGIKDIVYVPFDFNRSAITDYKGSGYGTLIQLFNNEYGFEMRIAHMHPKEDILKWSHDRLKKGMSMKAGWILGKAGTYGNSSGNHTHTEIISLDDSCEVFDILLEEQYGDKSLKEITPNQVIKEYKKQHNFKDSSDRTILKDWEAVKAYRGCFFYNKYKYKFQRPSGLKYTRYASNYLFNGL